MILPIYTYGEYLLTLPAIDFDIAKGEKEFIQKTYIPNMFETMYNANGSGLAAPQLGNNWKIFVVDVEISDGVIFKGVFINPKILLASGPLYTMTEACLSLPGIKAQVIRPGTIEMEYYDENWEYHKEIFEGIPARVLQHEYDHLFGKLFIDHIDLDTKGRLLLPLMNIKQKKIKTLYPII